MRVLYVATVSYAGMMPFASTIINSMKNDDIFCLLISSQFGDYQNCIEPSIWNKCYFSKESNNKFINQFDFLFPIKSQNLIHSICKKNNIEIIHLLTSDSSLSRFVRNNKNKYKFHYTVHDLNSHEAKTSLFLKFKRKIEYYRIKNIIKNTNNISTCSNSQYLKLKTIYPNKNIFFFPFPSLITQKIITGTKAPPEINGISNYLLFFGRVEEYKGINLLCNAYLSTNEFKCKFKLVIAGKGNLNLDKPKTEDIIFINRYLGEDEIQVLFSNSCCTIFPYISATQSGVLSLSYFFGKPVIVSDIPFLKDNVEENLTGLIFKNSNLESLKNSLIFFANFSNLFSVSYIKNYYKNKYSTEELKKRLKELY